VMKNMIVHAGQVITGVNADNEAEVIEDGAIEVTDGDITRIGTLAELSRERGHLPVIGGAGFVAFPGFVNAHHHVGLTPLQLGSPDLPLELWISQRIGGKTAPLYLDTLYSAFEMVRSGVTTVQHLQGRIVAPISNVHEKSHEVLSAYRDIGMRASYSFGVREQNRIVYEDDEKFISRLPSDLGGRVRSFLATQTVAIEDHLQLFETLRADLNGDPLLAVQLAPVNLQWCSDASLIKIRDMSVRFGTPIHMHLLETPFQEAYARQRAGGKTAVEHVHRLGLLNERITLGHGVWMTDGDLDLIQQTGAHICHNCSSNMRLRSGRAPMNAMRHRGINVAIGMDEAGLNDDRDMLQEMRVVLHSNRVPGLDSADVPSPTDVFRMATEFGANTTPFKPKIGRLAKGRAADIVLLDWSQVSYPFLDAGIKAIDALVHRAKSSGVHTVMVNGRVVLQDGQFTLVDEQSILDEIVEILNQPMTEAESSLRQMAGELIPHITDFFQDYRNR
jgi:5-methylthioadenosine/S-adenosylhomocysteine deaminase